MTQALEVHRLTAGYGPLRVLHGIDLQVGAGERVGLVGLNGHGKTTLLRAIVGLVDWLRGDISFQGRTISRAATHSLARAGLVMIPQGDSLFPGLTVRENLDTGAFAARNWKVRATRRAGVVKLFPKLGDRLDQLAGTLSGGERRMVSVGRALMAEADVYLIDEPSLGLAPGIAELLIDTLTSLDLRGGAMLIAEQNRTLVAGKLDRVLRMHGGKIVDSEDSGADEGPAPDSSEEAV